MNPQSAQLYDQLLVGVYDARGRQLDGFSGLVHRGYLAGHLTDQHYGQLVEAVQTRRNVFGARARLNAHRRPVPAPVQARDELRKARDRRRVWGGSGALPHHLRSLFTPGENAVAAVVRAEVRKHGHCALSWGAIAKAAGLLGTTVVKRFIRLAKAKRLIHVVERPVKGARNEPNVVTIVDRDWIAWIEGPAETGQRGHGGISIQSVHHKNTLYDADNDARQRTAGRPQWAGRKRERPAAMPAPS